MIKAKRYKIAPADDAYVRTVFPRCAYCDASAKNLEIEHIIARSKGGSWSAVCNLVMSCVRCNHGPGGKHERHSGWNGLAEQPFFDKRRAAGRFSAIWTAGLSARRRTSFRSIRARPKRDRSDLYEDPSYLAAIGELNEEAA